MHNQRWIIKSSINIMVRTLEIGPEHNITIITAMTFQFCLIDLLFKEVRRGPEETAFVIVAAGL